MLYLIRRLISRNLPDDGAKYYEGGAFLAVVSNKALVSRHLPDGGSIY